MQLRQLFTCTSWRKRSIKSLMLYPVSISPYNLISEKLVEECFSKFYHLPLLPVSSSNQFSLFLQVPRALVNLVELLHIVPLRRLHQDPSIGCPTWLVKWVSPVFFFDPVKVIYFLSFYRLYFKLNTISCFALFSVYCVHVFLNLKTRLRNSKSCRISIKLTR